MPKIEMDLGQRLFRHLIVEAKNALISFLFRVFPEKSNSFVCYAVIIIGRNETPHINCNGAKLFNII